VLPFAFLSGFTAIAVSAVLSALGLAAIGAAITVFTGRSVMFSSAQQVLFGLAAAAITYGVGRLIGVNLG
jgi:VIT1/CCC1 family predicted Fe2+/Mn2+ transporter